MEMERSFLYDPRQVSVSPEPGVEPQTFLRHSTEHLTPLTMEEEEEHYQLPSGTQSPLTILEEEDEEDHESGGLQSRRPANALSVSLPYRPRQFSPSRIHNRPPSGGGHTMQRAYSSPGLDSSGRYVVPTFSTPRRPVSPLFSGRRRSPLRTAFDDSYPSSSSFSGLNIEPNIPENEELDLTESDLTHTLGTSHSNTFPRARRKPHSFLHQSASAPSLYARSTSPSLSHSPAFSTAAQKYANEPYPIYSFSSASSMPSTPTSMRSRSPSISSLDTIEDTPDAEEAAQLAEEEDLKQRGEDSDGGSGNEGRRRTSPDVRGVNLKSNKERKRWSVCGAERRADFSLEPIEE